MDQLVIRGAREHNLRNISLELPRDRLIVFTGLSGSGKSSLAFDTIYAEGQRRYVESLSSYARQFLGQMDKPDVDFIEGLSPAISIDQKSAVAQPALHRRHDHRDLRLPPPAVRPHRRPALPERRRASSPARRRSRSSTGCSQLPEGTRFQVLAPVVRGRKGTYDTLLADLAGQGFARGRVDGELHELAGSARRWPATSSTPSRSSSTAWCAATGIERRLTDSLETALQLAEGVAEVADRGPPRRRPAVDDRDPHLQPAPGLPAVRA